MWQCHYCHFLLDAQAQEKNRDCPNCGSDLHSCKNCLYFDETLTAKCTEPDSPWIVERSAHNDCGFFQPMSREDFLSKSPQTSDAQKAKEAFKALFK